MAYNVAPEMAAQFSAQEIEQYRVAFSQFDQNGDGSIDESELHVVTQKIGVTMTRQRLNSMIRAVDQDGNKMVEFNEFLAMMASFKAGDGGGMADMVVKAGKSGFFEVSGTHGTHQSRAKMLPSP